jgi:hypothetical protein
MPTTRRILHQVSSRQHGHGAKRVPKIEKVVPTGFAGRQTRALLSAGKSRSSSSSPCRDQSHGGALADCCESARTTCACEKGGSLPRKHSHTVPVPHSPAAFSRSPTGPSFKLGSSAAPACRLLSLSHTFRRSVSLFPLPRHFQLSLFLPFLDRKKVRTSQKGCSPRAL